MRYLIAYDISSPKRLRKVARRLEKDAVRIQKSVFVAIATHQQVVRLLNDLGDLISPRHDIIQAFRLASDQPADGFLRGAVTPAAPNSVVHIGGRTSFVLGENDG